MGNMHKYQSRNKVKQVNWYDIGQNKQGKNMISIRKEMHQAKGTLMQD